MKIDKEKAIFLLGGHDLEMITIREILEENEIKYFDKSPKWGARLSDYKDVIVSQPEKTFYGVELEEDMSLPKNYVRIDHHNDFSHKEASLLQILKLLDIKRTSKYELIAANDVNHKEGLRCLGATKEQIDSIRKQDREAQGIGYKEEDIAKSEIENIDKSTDIATIQSSLDSFTPIADFCDVRPLIVYSQEAFMFYGDITKLKEVFAQEILEHKAFHGKQYFGFDKKYVKNKTVDKCLTMVQHAVKDVKKKEEIYSYHTFMLPFRFDKILESFEDTYDFYQKHEISKRVEITQNFKELLQSDGWEHKPFKVENNFDYNEYAYFYSYIRETLYNKSEFKENDTSYFFEKPYKGGQFNIKIKDTTYELELEGLSLRIFETGIAIFSIEVSNKKFSQSKIEDILKINEYARRIYAPFLGKWDSHANWTQAPKDSQLAESIQVILPDGTVCEDRFCQEYLAVPEDISMSPYIMKLLGLSTFSTHKEDIGQYYVQPVIDDRMFVLCWYGNDDFSTAVSQNRYKENAAWYEYVFVDGDGITVANKEMQEKLITNATYDRWMDYSDGTTLFGLSRYSFVCLCNGSDFSRDVLSLPHMKTMYYQMFTLLLAIRASTLRFSEEVTALSNIKNETEDNFSQKVSQLYKYYIKFVNKIYFREITAQEQGIELYDKASSMMRIERDVKDLDAEIAELHTYVSLKAEEKQLEQAEERENRLAAISKLGAVFLPPSLIAGIFGMNIFDFEQSYWSFFIILIFMILSALGSYKLISYKTVHDDSNKDEQKDFYKILGIVSVLMGLIIIFVLIAGVKKENIQKVNVTNAITLNSAAPSLNQKEEKDKNENNQTN